VARAAQQLEAAARAADLPRCRGQVPVLEEQLDRLRPHLHQLAGEVVQAG
jgi:hypothetical protein